MNLAFISNWILNKKNCTLCSIEKFFYFGNVILKDLALGLKTMAWKKAANGTVFSMSRTNTVLDLHQWHWQSQQCAVQFDDTNVFNGYGEWGWQESVSAGVELSDKLVSRMENAFKCWQVKGNPCWCQEPWLQVWDGGGEPEEVWFWEGCRCHHA